MGEPDSQREDQKRNAERDKENREPRYGRAESSYEAEKPQRGQDHDGNQKPHVGEQQTGNAVDSASLFEYPVDRLADGASGFPPRGHRHSQEPEPKPRRHPLLEGLLLVQQGRDDADPFNADPVGHIHDGRYVRDRRDVVEDDVSDRSESEAAEPQYRHGHGDNHKNHRDSLHRKRHESRIDVREYETEHYRGHREQPQGSAVILTIHEATAGFPKLPPLFRPPHPDVSDGSKA